jgi:tetratricopeptide (TPR) repeat protein
MRTHTRSFDIRAALNAISVTNGTGTLFALDRVVLDCFNDYDDVFIEARQPREFASIIGSVLQKLSQPDAKEISAAEANINANISRAREFQAQMQLKKAQEIYGEMLLVAERFDTHSMLVVKQVLHQQLGVIALHNHFASTAAEHFERAAHIASIMVAKGATPLDSKDMALLQGLWAKSLFFDDNAEEAVRHFDVALSSLGMAKKYRKERLDLQAWKARSLYSMAASNARARSEAIKLLEAAIKLDEHHVPSLAMYSVVAYECGQGLNALPHVLRAIVGASSQKQVEVEYVELAQDILAKCVSLPGGVAALIRDLAGAANSPPAVSFLASTVKDRGAVAEAAQLYKHIRDKGDFASQLNVTLALVHTLECQGLYSEAFATLQRFLQDNATASIGSELIASQFALCLLRIKDINSDTLKRGEALSMPSSELPRIAEPAAEAKRTEVLSESDLQLLALLFVAVKILFLHGALQVLPAMVHLLEPVRQGRDLHLTSIRNEHAYYSAVALLLRAVPFPLPTIGEGLEPVYVVGDSHCLASAWQTVALRSGLRLLFIPRLVTGMKCWHLRPESNFYTKRNFESALRSVPDRARVVFVFGEIDCREGLLVAVEKGKYPSIEVGIEKAVQVYVKALETATRARGFKSFVHPVAPVLPITRGVVIRFTSALRRSVAASSSLQYLDFFEHLLTPDGGKNEPDFPNNPNLIGEALRPEYELDGTHLHPVGKLNNFKPYLYREVVLEKKGLIYALM